MTLPKEWKYLDIGVGIGVALAVLATVLFIIAVTGGSSNDLAIASVLMGIFAVLITVIMAFFGTRKIKKEM